METEVQSSGDLRRELHEAGFTYSAIDAVWPQWWSDEAESSLSASTELRYTLARRLGLAPRSLFEGPPQFIWRDETKFKNLGTETDQDRAILSSFGTAVGRSAISATLGWPAAPAIGAEELRLAILEKSEYVRLPDLLSFCWAVGIPVLYLEVFPLGGKFMHAMAVRSRERYAVILGRESSFASQVAYWLAHEVAHIMLRHLGGEAALLEVGDPLQFSNRDVEERDADAYALTLLTGQPSPTVFADRASFSASQLANAALKAASNTRIDPGVLALCLGHGTGQWEQVMGALKILESGGSDVKEVINSIAKEQMDWPAMTSGTRDYLLAVLGGEGER